MNDATIPRHIDELMRLFKEDPSDSTLTAQDLLRLAYEFQKQRDTDRGSLLAGVYTQHMSAQVRTRGLLHLAEIAYAERRYEDCIQTANQLLEISPANLGGLCIRALGYALSSRKDRVEKCRNDLAEAGRILTFLGGEMI